MSGTAVQRGLSKLKKKHFRVKHQKVKLFRANEPILSVFMWGVNHTVSLHNIPHCSVNNFPLGIKSCTMYSEECGCP